MRCYFLLLFLFTQSLLMGCGQATYDERLKANIDNPSRITPQAVEEKEEESGEAGEEWTEEELKAADALRNE